MKCKDMGKLWEEFNIRNTMAIAVTRSLNGRFDSTKDFSTVNMQNSMSGSMLAASITGAFNAPSIPIIEIDSLSHYDYDGDTAGPLKKVKHSMIREQIGFYNAFTNPYIGDPFESKKEKILDVFNSRLKLIRDNKINILKKIGERYE